MPEKGGGEDPVENALSDRDPVENVTHVIADVPI